MPFSRQRSRSRRASVAGLVACLALPGLCVSAFAAPKTTEQTEQDYNYATLLLDDLRAVPILELGKRQYVLVAKAFRKVHASSPGGIFGDDSLLSEAQLYLEAARRFGPEPYLSEAADAYRILVQEYPASEHKERAGQALDELKAGGGAKSVLAKLSRAPLPSQAPEAGNVADTVAETVVTRQSQAPASATPPPPTPVRHEPQPIKRRKRGPAIVQNVRFWTHEDYTRVVVEIDDQVHHRFEELPRPHRLFVDLKDARLGGKLSRVKDFTLPVGDSLIKQIRVGQNRRSVSRVVFDLEQAANHSVFWLSNPGRFVIELRSAREPVRITKAPARREGTPPAAERPNETLLARLDTTVAPAPPPLTRLPAAQDRQDASHQTQLDSADAASPTNLNSANSNSAYLNSTSDSSSLAVRSSYPDVAGTPPVAAPPRQPPPATQVERYQNPGSRAESAPGEAALPADQTPSILAAGPRNSEAMVAGIGHVPVPELGPEPKLLAEQALRAEQTLRATQATSKARKSASGAANPDPQLLAKLTPPEPSPPPLAAPPPAPAVELTEPPKAASATSRGQRNLIRALGLKVGRVVIDAGHGGHDTGTIGSGGLREKDLVLDIASRLGELIQNRLGADVIYTRTDDQFIHLKERTRLANISQADLFISVHANSSRLKNIRGVETYYLSFTTSSSAMAVAARENAAAQHSIHELQGLLSKIALTEKIQESREFAGQVQNALYGGLSKDTKGLRNRGVRKAPFMVLIGAEMPAILAEVGFLSNPSDEKLLKASEYRQNVAEHIFKGVEMYSNSLSKMTIAQKQAPPSSPEKLD